MRRLFPSKKSKPTKQLQELREKGITVCPPHVSFTYPNGQEICTVCRVVLKAANR